MTAQRALVIGGTGPTGPHLVNGLLDRGYDVTIMHRGTHDSDLIPASVERLIGDPHFRETLADTLGDRTFDLVVATYGRIRYIAEEMTGRTGRLVTVGGPPSYRGMFDADGEPPRGMPIPTPEDAPRVESEEEHRFGHLIRITEDAVMACHDAGHYQATHFRYPVVYGPGQLGASMWDIVRRAVDRRPHIVLADGGMGLVSRGFNRNVAHAVLCAVDHPDAAAGNIYNCADDQQFTHAQWVQLICRAAGHDIEIVGLPASVALANRELFPLGSPPLHQLLDTAAIRNDLGYADVVAPVDGIAATAAWCLDHLDLAPTNPLNYEAEDQQVALYREFLPQLAAVEHDLRDVHHPYPHPKQAGLSRDHRQR
jgi:nucleoside-diphosphate-sugar epimerase